MVYFRKCFAGATFESFDTGVLEDKGCGLVFTSNSLSSDRFHIRYPSRPPVESPLVSIVICTYGRPESLNATLISLTHQTFRDFEVLLITEKGNLAELRHKGLVSSAGSIVSFIDDDVYCEPTWLASIVKTFEKDKTIVGVTGPTTITDEYKKNRDLFKYRFFKRLYDILFISPFENIPSRLSTCGAPSTASNDHEISYSGKCDFLEACNMSVKKKEAIDVGGFDSIYYRTSEWCEVDLALKLGRIGTLYFSKDCQLYHRPSKAGVYKHRLSTKHRWDNFISFQRRWVRNSIRTHVYRGFIWLYLKLKNTQMI